MYINKSTAKVLQLFTSNITDYFTLREVARKLQMHVSYAHRAVKPLLEAGILIQDKHKNLYLNYRNHHETLAFVEYLRRDDFLSKNKDIRLLSDEIINKLPFGYFSLLIFGSAVNTKKPKDIDLLLIIERTEDIEGAEKALYNIYRNYNIKIHPVVLSFESVYEMLKAREENNLVNEVLNKHVILYGAELFYRLLSWGR